MIQIYIGKKKSDIYRPIKELKAFKKCFVPAHSTQRVCIEVDLDDVKAYRNATDSFELEDGEYEVYAAVNTAQIIQEESICLKGVRFEEESQPRPLAQKEAPCKYTLDTPAGVLFKTMRSRNLRPTISGPSTQRILRKNCSGSIQRRCE